MIITTVAIIEDDKMLRSTMVDHLTFVGNYTVVYSGDSVDNFLGKKIEADVDIVLLDVHLFNTNSVSYINLILKRYPKSNIIIITGDKSDDLILEGIEEGARGYLIKPFSILQLNDIILSVLNNGSYLQPIVQSKLLRKLNSHKSVDLIQRRYGLTKRELDIFNHIKMGYSYKEISVKLNISYHTVNHHMKNLYFKFNVNSKGQLLSKYL